MPFVQAMALGTLAQGWWQEVSRNGGSSLWSPLWGPCEGNQCCQGQVLVLPPRKANGLGTMMTLAMIIRGMLDYVMCLCFCVFLVLVQINAHTGNNIVVLIKLILDSSSTMSTSECWPIPVPIFAHLSQPDLSEVKYGDMASRQMCWNSLPKDSHIGQFY